MDAATRKLAVFVLTYATDADRKTAAEKVKNETAEREFSEKGKEAATSSDVKDAFDRVLDRNADLLDLLAESLEEALTDAGKDGDFGIARSAVDTDPKSGLDDGDAKKLADLTAKVLSAPLNKRLNSVLEEVATSLDAISSCDEGRSGDPGQTWWTEIRRRLWCRNRWTHRRPRTRRTWLRRDSVREERPTSALILRGQIGHPPVKLGGMAASHRAGPAGPAANRPARNQTRTAPRR